MALCKNREPFQSKWNRHYSHWSKSRDKCPLQKSESVLW